MMIYSKFGIAFVFEFDQPADPSVGIFDDSFELTGDWEMDDMDQFREDASRFDWDGTEDGIPGVVELMMGSIESRELEDAAADYYDDL